jgi:hypothetical protein
LDFGAALGLAAGVGVLAASWAAVWVAWVLDGAAASVGAPWEAMTTPVAAPARAEAPSSTTSRRVENIDRCPP